VRDCRKGLVKTSQIWCLLAATFFSISAENYINVLRESSSTGISFMHTDVTQ